MSDQARHVMDAILPLLPDMRDAEFKALVDALDDECIRRGWPCCPWLPPIHEHAETA